MTNTASEHKVSWLNVGTLSRHSATAGRGVYAFVYSGTPARIIYVGTATSDGGFNRRLRAHVRLFHLGARTVWRPGPGQDVYDLMCGQGKRFYRNLAEAGKAWLPSDHTNPADPPYRRCYYDEVDSSYSSDWRDYVLMEYLDRLTVWTCEVDDGFPPVLETQIQIALGRHFRLGYYDGTAQNWLGQQKIKDAAVLRAHRFTFPTPLVADAETMSVINDLERHFIE